ncbi:M56 family metallopeptidase [Salmonirosea aquatica]|uniref:Peptidase M56 BlaR1 n=1 Tax=Salmonirosea aquatica TaxID=2654236 RepID=A0A7C9FBT3_9BACT|nr:peptidase M56 BlaR1 [Cytophagaceae bacterium SJW1-29]
MSPIFDYLLKLSISLAVVGLFYQLVLRRHTFYTENRWYLLKYSALSFFIPFIDLNRALPQTDLDKVPLVQHLPTIQSLSTPGPVPAFETPGAIVAESELAWGDWVLLLLLAGVVFMFLRLLLHGVAYLRIKRRARLVSEESVKIYHVERNIVPFSFGNAIFINPTLHQESELQEIMLHELVHVRQRHTFDILFGEVLCVLNWYNPFAWLIRHAIRQNLEFIADRAVLENGVDARAYQFLLLKVSGVPEFRLANQFNFSSLKQRIIMMNRRETAKVYMVRFFFALPMMLVLLAMFRTDIEALAQKESPQGTLQTVEANYAYLAGILIDGATGQPLANVPLEEKEHAPFVMNAEKQPEPKVLGTIYTDADGFYFWKVDIREQEQEDISYSLQPKDKKYKELWWGSNVFASHNPLISAEFKVAILTENLMDRLRQDYYLVFPPNYPVGTPVDYEPSTVKQLLLANLPKFTAEHTLKIDFKKAYWKPRDIITKFREGYFNKERELIGYEGMTEFYLDGKQATYEEVNREFKQRPIALGFGQNSNPLTSAKVPKKIYYQTFVNFKDTPPAELVNENTVEWVAVTNFDIDTLQNEPYMLDGFRQVLGTSSNLVPLKEEIVRVAILKNKLARYYAPKLDKLWWIETRPPAEVQGRPDFAQR